MRLKLGDKIIYIEESVIIVLFVCLLSKTARAYLENYYICYLFIVFHELSHMTLAVLLGNSIKKVNIRVCGLNINLRNNLFGMKALIVYLAGPISNLILAALFYKISLVFEINICLAIINLLPIKPLDGYNILKLIAKTNITKIISIIIEIIMFLLAIIILIKYCNISLIFLLIYIKLEELNTAKRLAFS